MPDHADRTKLARRKALAMSDSQWKPDILGAGYVQKVIHLGDDPDGEGTVEAVLVRREPQSGEDARGVVLYVHGFTDYFFQAELADFLAARGLPFYALDLRKCGRARRPGQTAHYVSDLALYDAELDRALAIVTAAHPGLPVTLVAHSTGGLVVPLWLARRRGAGTTGACTTGAGTSGAGTSAAPIAGVALNSPWLDLQGSPVLRDPVTQAIRVLARVAPMAVLPLKPGVYGQTLHVSGTGEWDFDLDLKPLVGFPVTFGWINAIRRGHARVHHGLDIDVPVLVLRSARSLPSGAYTPMSDHADLVIDTAQIGHWAGSLGGKVTDVPIDGARHDVFLSLSDPRARAYEALDAWLAGIGHTVEQDQAV
jgi:alpha-beta hydrolase superfamily lysophospholipase